MIRIILFLLFTLMPGLLIFSGESASEPDKTTYPEHLPDRLTGGFGEQTCHSCHFDYPLNFEQVSLHLEGFPEQYKSGQAYFLRISVGRPDLKIVGFQLSARFSNGRQAGFFKPQSDRIQFTEAVSDTIQYIQHTAKGTKVTGEEMTPWTVKWIAPKSAREVYFHLAANAANGDASEFGDFIIAKEVRLSPR